MNVTREMLEMAGFECVLDICAACGHSGSEHNLWNRCLTCSNCQTFSSMKEDAKWDYALDNLEMLRLEAQG